jgi:transcriptional regulator with XRE-family HTH domain
MKKKPNVPREVATVEQKQLKVIGRALQNARLDLKLSLQQVQSKSLVSYITISKIEKGELDNCSMMTLNKVAAAVGKKIVMTVE